MSFRLEREKTELTPYVLIDEDKGYMRLEGESYHENVVEYFRELNEWLGSFLKKDFASFTFDCELKYFNSSTVKLLLNMLLAMDKSPCSEKVTVNWVADLSNKIIIECGEDFQEDLENLTFNLVTR